jgi:hypothetical protein
MGVAVHVLDASEVEPIPLQLEKVCQLSDDNDDK